jgi:uncharacterized protein (DUF58 family)
MRPEPISLLDSRFLRRLEFLSLRARRVHPGPLPALRPTPLRGHGLEFADHQPYTPGDDLRYLDWNVYARQGQMLLKRFHEERDLRVDLLLDASRSMGLGQPSKFSCARQVVAALAYIGLAGLDRLAVTAFADSVVARHPVIRGKNQILGLLRFLESLEVSGADTSLEQAARSIIQRTEPTGVAIVVSDFLDPAGYERALDLLRYRRFDVYLLQVLEPRELRPDWLGDMELLDVETGQLRPLVVRERTQRLYCDSMREFVQGLRGYARRHGMGFISSTTEQPFDELVLHMMRQSDWLTGG